MVLLPRLREHRTRAALEQGELADLAGVHRNTLSRLERGYEATPATARTLAKALRLQPADLMQEDFRG